MPYLTSTAAGTASTDLGLGFGIPGYAHPLSLLWSGAS